MKEIKCLNNIGFIKRVDDSKWWAPYPKQPKKNGKVQYISKFINLNKQIKRKPYSMPETQEIMLNIEVF